MCVPFAFRHPVKAGCGLDGRQAAEVGGVPGYRGVEGLLKEGLPQVLRISVPILGSSVYKPYMLKLGALISLKAVGRSGVVSRGTRLPKHQRQRGTQ